MTSSLAAAAAEISASTSSTSSPITAPSDATNKGKINSNNNRRRKNNGKNNTPSPHQHSGGKSGPTTNSNDSVASVADPRGDDPTKRMKTRTKKKGNGRNTESFDPKSTLVRPALRVLVGLPTHKVYPKPLKHDDVMIVPELFGPEDDYTMYKTLQNEITELQKTQTKGCEFVSWHEGAHLIVKNPPRNQKQFPTFNKVIDRLCEYYEIQPKSIGTRFNFYTDLKDWKPFHHDSAAFNPQRAKTQNITVGVSFGATRELAFLRANEEDKGNEQCRLYFPQPNNGVFSFGRDVNIHWKHGVNAVSEEDIARSDAGAPQGRISIILWGLATNVIEEDGSPPLLGADGQGPHAAVNNNKYHNNRAKPNRNSGNRNNGNKQTLPRRNNNNGGNMESQGANNSNKENQ